MSDQESGDEGATTGVVKKLMYVNRRAPYGSIYALEALEIVLVGAAFDQDVSVAFMDDGVYQLKRGQDTEGIGMKNFSPAYRALEMYDVEKLFVEEESMLARGLRVEDLLVPVDVLSAAALGRLMDEQDVLFNF